MKRYALLGFFTAFKICIENESNDNIRNEGKLSNSMSKSSYIFFNNEIILLFQCKIPFKIKCYRK